MTASPSARRISRRALLTGGAATVAAAAAALVYGGRGRERRFNVVVLVLDDVHPTCWTKMPYLNSRPGRKWVRFTNAIATFPLCRPSRATVLTGRYASNHGLVTNNEAAEGLRWMRDHEHHNLMWWMHSAGYRVGFFGKYLNAYPFDFEEPGFAYRPPGVDRWHANGNNSYRDYAVSEDGRLLRVTEPDTWTGVGYTEAARVARSLQTGYRTDRTSRELTTWVAAADEPFFAIAAHSCPHVDASGVDVPAAARHRLIDVGSPIRGQAFDEIDVSDKPGWVQDLPPLDEATQSALDAEQEGQWRSLLAFDESIYDLMAVLRSRGALDRTVIMVLTDNGLMLGEHRSRSKAQVYREALRGEIWLHHPDAAARDEDAVVGNVDIAPTVCDIGRTQATEPFDGRSLTPLIRDGDARWRERILVEYVNPSTRHDVGSPGFTGWVSRAEKYAELDPYRHHPAEAERYHLASDPHELDNLGLSRTHAHVLERLRRASRTTPER